jgi:chemotaxis protein methyltransferase WspC
MIHADIEDLLRHAIGLDAASIGSSAVARAVKERLSVCELRDAAAYFERVRGSVTELQALIEAVIVPETWFFREREAFEELARVATHQWLPGNRGTLRLLSVPCSSGEEPYSMAMALLDAGFPLHRCRIDAVDISAQGLEAARGAVYGNNSFRGTDLTFRDRYCVTAGAKFSLSEAVRTPVHFQQGNVLSRDFLPGSALYDMIFCRNLLIYFDRTTQDRAVEVLKRLLKPQGVLFVGPSESGLLLSHDFDSTRVPLTFAFRRRGSAPVAMAIPAPVQALATRASKAHPASPARVSSPNLARRPSLATATDSAAPAPAPQGPAHEAFRLADQGRMAEAAAACEEHLRQHGPSVQCFFLLGLIRSAAGNVNDARQYYRKALYLDRYHEGTLLHLRVLLETQGDAAGAQIIRDRLQRLAQKKTA